MMPTPEIGHRIWAIPEGYIPPESHGPAPQMISHEVACILNASPQEAQIEFTIYFEDRDPVGPFKFVVPAQRTRHLRFNNFEEPESIPLDTSFASVVRSNVPIVVQHTRLDSRQSENALLTTVAFPVAS